jgi:L-ribulokinase
LIVDTVVGREIATAVWDYEHGDAGVILSRDPNLARQHPADYLKGAAKLRLGKSDLIGLGRNHGNRAVLVDQRLTGLLLGQTLYTTPAEIYRALIEATAFGALTIINRFEEYGVKIQRVVNCGGIADKNPLVMQIYADVTGRPMKLSRSEQTCALGAAVAAAVVAGAHRDFASAIRAMTGLKTRAFTPNPQAQAVYRELYSMYSALHDAFGKADWQGTLHRVMKQLINVRSRARS